jgi:hypothetical protein
MGLTTPSSLADQTCEESGPSLWRTAKAGKCPYNVPRQRHEQKFMTGLPQYFPECPASQTRIFANCQKIKYRATIRTKKKPDPP